MMAHSPGGRGGPSGFGISRMIAELISKPVRPSNGRRPEAASYRTTPSAQRSLRWSAASPRRISGAMYGKVPLTLDVFSTVAKDRVGSLEYAAAYLFG